MSSACKSSDDGADRVIDLDSNAPGTCLQFADDVGPEITKLPIVDCATPHSHEIFAIVLSQDKVYPGFDALESAAQAQCLAHFEGYVGISAFDSSLFYSWIVPTLATWDRNDDRQTICVIGNSNGAPLVGSVRNSDR